MSGRKKGGGPMLWRMMDWLEKLAFWVTVVAVTVWLRLPNSKTLALLITCLTVGYHIAVRMAVGHLVNARLHNHAHYRRWWFRVRPWEERLFRLLRVKQWKNKIPTYDPGTFDPKQHSWEEIAQTTCQSEVVHEANALLSFVPLLAVPLVGALPVFLTTSVLAALLDLSFVVIQRCNRGRIVHLLDRQAARKN